VSLERDINKATPQPNGRLAEPTVSQGEDIGSFRLNEQGLFHLETLPTKEDEEPPKRDWKWISAPIKALGLATDEHGKSSSIVIELRDTHGRTKTHVLPRATFAARSGEQVVRQLLDDGLTMSSAKGAPSLIRQYLMQCRPHLRYLLVHKPGWYERVFALPDCAFGEQGEHRIHFQVHPGAQQLIRTRGTFEDWLSAIGTHARGNSRLLFGISAAFAAPLLQLTSEESGVFHIKCSSSKGKTTLLMVAGSVCGGGGPLGFVRTWLTTANGVEMMCESCNDLLLALDELALCDPRVAGKVAYMIASGHGKARSSWTQNTATAAPTNTWRTIGLSSGELSLQQHVEAAADNSLYGGQLVRFTEMPAIADPELGIFDRIPDGFGGPAEFAEHLKHATALCYGAPLRKYLLAVTRDPDRYAREAGEIISAFAAEVADRSASSEIHRTARRFGLLVAGGLAGTKAQCTDWDCDDVWDSKVAMFRAWLTNRGSDAPADEERAVRQVRSLIESNLFRFVDLAGDPQAVREQFGYRKIDESSGLTLFLVWPETWAKIFCKGLDPVFVAKTLLKRGCLAAGEGRLQYQVKIPGFDIPKRLYAVSERILQSQEGK
jgi:putative DNA primase/helicase